MNPNAIPDIDDAQLRTLVDRFMTQGATFKELKGFTDGEMEAIYSVAYSLFQHGKSEDAEKVFRFLCFFDHLEKKFWLGLGASRKALGLHAGAVDAFGMSAILDLGDPRPAMQAAECHVALGNRQEAIGALRAVLGAREGEHGRLKDRARAMLEVLGEAAEPALAGASTK